MTTMLHESIDTLEGLTPAERVKRLSELSREAYWKNKDLAQSVALLDAAIRHGSAAAAADPATAVELWGLV